MGPAGRPRDLALALIISRVVAPASKPSTAGLVGRHHTEPDLGVAGASTDDVYAAMDWLAAGRTRSRPGWPPGTTAMLTEPTSTQREGFDLIGIPIPLTLK